MAERALRLFFALPLPPDLQGALARWRPEQAPHSAPARWSKAGGLHVTLAFLGERPAEALPALERIGTVVAGRHGPFPLAIAGLGGFPGSGRARVLWLGLEASPALEALAVDLRETLEVAGEPFDAKPFRAHVTLARFREPRTLASFENPPPAGFAADRLVLFESQPQGGYAPLQAWPLRTV